MNSSWRIFAPFGLSTEAGEDHVIAPPIACKRSKAVREGKESTERLFAAIVQALVPLMAESRTHFGGDRGAVTTGSDDVLRVVQTLMAAKVNTGGSFGDKDDGVAGGPVLRAAPLSPPPPPGRSRGT